MRKTPFISVIIPFYNVARFLPDAVGSVLDQTYTDWELLLADDGSTDGSEEIARGYERAYPGKIKYLQHPGSLNKGAAATRNLALRHARGIYLALLDSDDKWRSEKLAYQVSIAERYPEVSMICGTSIFWNSWADKTKKDIPEPVCSVEYNQEFLEDHPELDGPRVLSQGIEPGDQLIQAPCAALLLYPLGDQSAPCPCSILIKREAVLMQGGFEESFVGKYAFYEDQAFLIKIYLNESVYISHRAMDYYRIRPDSVMAQTAGAGNYGPVRLFFLRWLKKYLAREGVAVPLVHQKLKASVLKIKYPVWHTLLNRLGMIC